MKLGLLSQKRKKERKKERKNNNNKEIDSLEHKYFFLIINILN